QAMLLPAFVALFGVLGAVFLVGFTGSRVTTVPASAAGGSGASEDAAAGRAGAGDAAWVDDAEHDEWADDDDYVEFVVDWGDAATGPADDARDVEAPAPVTDRLDDQSVRRSPPAPSDPEWRTIFDQLLATPAHDPHRYRPPGDRGEEPGPAGGRGRY
ncbi:MAG: hypothetical protein SW019_24920, partial [Actinomycetota bacterium]|nr:hypothetical protein [Actinomycetota bacterium]